MKKTYLLDGLDCASCATKIEKAINNIDGVNSATISFATTKLVLDIDELINDDIDKITSETIKSIEPQVQLKKK